MKKSIQRFLESVENGETPSLEDCQAVAEAIRDLEAGQSITQALGKKGRRGRKAATGWSWAVYRVRELQTQGMTYEQATVEVAERLGVDDRTVKRWIEWSKNPEKAPAEKPGNYLRVAALLYDLFEK